MGFADEWIAALEHRVSAKLLEVLRNRKTNGATAEELAAAVAESVPMLMAVLTEEPGPQAPALWPAAHGDPVGVPANWTELGEGK